MKKITFILLLISGFCQGQIIKDYEKGPSRKDIEVHDFCKECKFHYAWYQGWHNVPDTSKEYTAYLVDINTGIKCNIHYMVGYEYPFFIMEELNSFQLPGYLDNLQREGYRMVSSNEWIKIGVGGVTINTFKEEFKISSDRYELTKPGEFAVFYWFKNYQPFEGYTASLDCP